MKSVKHAYIGLALTGLLCACGGGGGSNSNDIAAPTTPSSAPVTITKTNAPEVAASVYDSTVSAQNLGNNGVSGGGLTGAVVSTDDAGFDMVTFVRRQISRLPDLQSRIAANTVVAPVIPETTEPCEFGGTFTFSGEVADTSTVTAGDTLSFDFDNCDLGDAGLSSGKMTMQFNSITDDPAADLLGFDVTLTLENFSVTVAGETSSGNGDMRLVTPNALAADLEATLSGDAFTVTEGSEIATLTNFSITTSINAATNATVLDIRGTLEGSEIGGTVSYETTVPFQAVGDDNPFEGTMLITGADGSSLQFITLDAVNVRLDIDTDGDGAVDESVDTTWAELEQL